MPCNFTFDGTVNIHNKAGLVLANKNWDSLADGIYFGNSLAR
jgi:hypothetical protein